MCGLAQPHVPILTCVMKRAAVPAHRSASTMVLAVVALGLLCAGCTTRAGGTAIASAGSPSASPSAPSLPPESPIAASSATPPSLDTSTEPPPESTVLEPAMPEPPAASLAVEGGDPVVGELGSFTWQNSGSDGPWVPGAPIRVGSGERLTLTIASDVRIADWTVRRTPGATVGSGIVGMGEGSAGPVTFATPPRGSWSVNVVVWFADNLGSAAYYWLITVD